MFPKRTSTVSASNFYSAARLNSLGLLTVFCTAVLSWHLILVSHLPVPQKFPLFALIICVLSMYWLARYDPQPAPIAKLLQNTMLYIILAIVFGLLLPIPTPFSLVLVIMAILTYYDFGLLAMDVGLAFSLIAPIIVRAGHGGISHAALVSLGLTYLAVVVVAHFVVTFLRFAANEVAQVDKASSIALAHEQQVQSLINNITDGVIALDHTFKVVMYNAAALDVLDLNTAIRGKLIDKLFKPVDAERQKVSMRALLSETPRPTINRDLRVVYKDGSTANLFIGIAPIYLGYGKAENNGFTLILRDITREKSLEEERDEFISVVSHELRTPIAISEGNISNAQYMLDRKGATKEAKLALDEAHKQVLFLADMINDLSTLSRAERGVLEVNAEPIDVKAFMTELANNYTPQAEEKGLKFNVDIDASLTTLQSSRLYVREVLQNFITNAIKYTEKGSVTLSAHPAPKGVSFAVTDTGIGISKGDQERVYDKFFRSEDFRTRKNSGTGLGLYVTMKLARLIHATLSLESELNKGSTFTVLIPNFEAEPKPKATEEA